MLLSPQPAHVGHCCTRLNGRLRCAPSGEHFVVQQLERGSWHLHCGDMLRLRHSALLLLLLNFACGDDDGGFDGGSTDGATCEMCPAGWSVVLDPNNPYCPFEATDCVQRPICGGRDEYKCAPDECAAPRCESNEIRIALPMGPNPALPPGPVTSRSACGLSIECSACSGTVTCPAGEIAIDAVDIREADGLACTEGGTRLFRCQDEAQCFGCLDASSVSGEACTDEESAEECTPGMCGSEAFGCRPMDE